MNSILTFIDELHERPSTAALGKVGVVCSAYVIGLGGWYRMWVESFSHVSSPEAGPTGAAGGLAVLFSLVLLSLVLGVIMGHPGLERAAAPLAWIITHLLGYTVWLAFIGLLYGVLQLACMVLA